MNLLNIYRAQFKITFATQLQYRAELLIWLLGMVLEPVIYLVVWSAVSKSHGGEIDGFAPRDFAAYFIITMMVNFLTFDWHMWEFEFRIKDGGFSPLLLRPVHPIHADLASNITYKILMLAVMLPVAAVLALVFDAPIHPDGQTAVLFLAALFLAFVLRSMFEWTMALAGFWFTRMLARSNRVYYSIIIFLSGRMAPVALLPGCAAHRRRVASVPLDGFISVGITAGARAARTGRSRSAVSVGLDRVHVRAAQCCLARGHPPLLQSGKT